MIESKTLFEFLDDCEDTLGLESVYEFSDEFEDFKAPYLAYKETATHPFAADNVVYFIRYNYELALWSLQKDFDLQQKIESLLRKHEIFFTKDEGGFDEGTGLHVAPYQL